MPELPEVETIRRGLYETLVGRQIEEVEVRNAKMFEGESEELLGLEVTDVQRRGKLLVLQMGDKYLTIHLKMTGQLIVKRDGEDLAAGGHPDDAYLEDLPNKHTHVIITFISGEILYYNDIRKFGRMRLVSAEQLLGDKFVNSLGPEPFDPEFTPFYLQARLTKRGNVPIKSFLLDQSEIAGLGNIYADEALFCAAIRPDRKCKTLGRGEVSNLHDCIQETIELAIKYGGSSARDYVNAVGEKGTYLKIANVYKRENLTCNRCNEDLITRTKIGGRSSHFCPTCQR